MTHSEHRLLRGPESHEALRIISELRQAGFVAYLAGGCVRDALLQKPPKDYDVATDATPDAIRKVFGKSRTLAFGASFGVIGVLPPRRGSGERSGKVAPTEVATFRSDGFYSDGRRPDSVHFGDARHDALRRDFTINGLFYDPHLDEVIDYVGGEDDLHAGILRTIGNPLERFGEDKLRMLRAVRFATTLGFQIDSDTNRAIVEHAEDIAMVSGERIGAEMNRILTSPNAVDGLQLLTHCGLRQVVLPELSAADLSHMRLLLEQLTPLSFPLVLACLLRSLPDADAALKQISRRWRLSNEGVRQTTAALRHWSIVARADSLPWATVQPVLLDRDIEFIIGLADAIVCSQGSDRGGIETAIDALGWPAEKLNPPPLLTGDDLRQMGLVEGPQYREILQRVREAQLNGEIRSREQAIELAK